MPRYLWLRITVVVTVIVASVLLVSPRDWRGRPRQPINLGLDLQGGIHLVLGVDLDKGIENVLDRMGADLRSALQRKGIGAQVTRQGHTGLAVQLASAQALPDAQRALADFTEFDTRSQDPAAGRLEIVLKEKAVADRRNAFVDQGLKVIRNRVDQFGVAEPTIQKQGDNRILVQLPGVQDPARRPCSSSSWSTTRRIRSRPSSPDRRRAPRSSTGVASTPRRRPRPGSLIWSGRRPS
jgi:preprotein translocase subunit SecD